MKTKVKLSSEIKLSDENDAKNLLDKNICRIEWDSHLTEESCKQIWSNYNGLEEYETCDLKEQLIATDCEYQAKLECVSCFCVADGRVDDGCLEVRLVDDKIFKTAPSRGEQKFWLYFIFVAVMIPIVIIMISYFQLYKLIKVLFLFRLFLHF